MTIDEALAVLGERIRRDVLIAMGVDPDAPPPKPSDHPGDRWEHGVYRRWDASTRTWS